MNLKILVYLNRVKTDYESDFDHAVDYFKRHGVMITFYFKQCNVHGYDTYHTNLGYGDRLFIKGAENLVFVDPVYDGVIFAFNGAEFAPPNIPTSNCFMLNYRPFINLQTHINDPVDVDYSTICHELMHALVKTANQRGFTIADVMDTYLENINPDSSTGNFHHQWINLQPFMQTYKYFKLNESTGHGHTVAELSPVLMQKLDAARGFSGIPYVISSGERTASENAAIGGVKDSAHLTGKAVDIVCTDTTRWAILQGMLQAGFTRIEVCTNHIHCDVLIDSTHPSPWLGVSLAD